MSEKLFEHIEDRIREAAENSVPPFDAQAWEKMEARLDEEKNNRRRYFTFWILAFLLILLTGAGLLFFTATPNKPQNENAVITQPGKRITDTDKQKLTTAGSLPATAAGKTTNSDNNNVTVLNKNGNPHSRQFTATSLPQPAVAGTINSKQFHSPKTFKGRTVAKINGGVADVVISGDAVTEADPTKNSGKPAQVKVAENTAQEDTLNNKVAPKITTEKKVPAKETSVPGKKQLQKNASSRFYIVGTIGADIAGVSLLSFQHNTLAPKYGGGIGFQLNKKISLQTGFYASRKKYVAGPGDYKAEAGTYLSTVKLIKVDASCLVYEIPLSMRYNLIKKPSLMFYGTTGLSSFIMKKEDYDYHYLSNNMYHQSTWSYTGNKNFFSFLTLGLGLEKKISSTFSVIAEPSVSIPLAGVGDGKVKLYSTALQVGLKYQPLKNMHKKKL